MGATISDFHFGVITVLLFLPDVGFAGAGYSSGWLLNLESKTGQIFGMES